MTHRSFHSLYNQSFRSDDEFVSNFVARQQILTTLCRRLKINGSENGGEHQILVGTRGMGKTSLLRRLAIEIDRCQDLSSHFIPLVFREEQYNVLSLRDFWQNCGEALAEWAETRGHNDIAARLDETLCSEDWRDDEGAVNRFLGEVEALGKRAVLMVDNLDLIINSLKEPDRWTLRGSLQMRGGPIVIGAATHSLRESTNRDAAFYEFFQPTYLEPLDLPETENCMYALAKGRGELGKQVVSILQSDPARLRVLHRLTGGNPRVLALTYRFLETTDTSDAMADLEMLLDEVTPYYKARIEEYQTPLQRATIDAIALHWDPITTTQLSKIMDLPSTTLSPQLIRLRKDGLIESTETSGSYAGHQITERFLNIWYLMRHGKRRDKQRMRWLVAFLSSFYSSNDLATIHQNAKTSGLAEYWTKDYADAFEQAKQRAAFQLNEQEPRTIQRAKKTGQDGGKLQSIDQMAKAMVNKAITLGQSGDAAAEIETYDALIARFGDSTETALLEQVAKAMVSKGITLGQSGDAAAAIETFDALIARFGDSTEAALLEEVAKATRFKAITLDQSGDAAAAIETYEQALGLLGKLSAQSAQQESSITAIRLGNLLIDYGFDEKRAEALFLQAAEDNPLSAYANLCWLYLSSGLIEEAIRVSGKLDELPPMGRALINAAMAFHNENFGQATELLKTALSGDLRERGFDFSDDIVRLVRVAISTGFGERLITWFEMTRFSERYAPIHVALLAAVRGEKLLIDSNPEVRHAAGSVYSRISIAKSSIVDK